MLVETDSIRGQTYRIARVETTVPASADLAKRLAIAGGVECTASVQEHASYVLYRIGNRANREAYTVKLPGKVRVQHLSFRNKGGAPISSSSSWWNS